MTTIGPKPEEGTPLTPLTHPKASRTDESEQVPSQGPIAPTASQSSTFLFSITAPRIITGFFARLARKAELRESIANKLTVGLPPAQALASKMRLAQLLENIELADLERLDLIADNPDIKEAIWSISQKYANEPRRGLYAMHLSLKHFGRLHRYFGERTSPLTIAKLVTAMKDYQLLDDFDELLNDADRIQAKRPTVFSLLDERAASVRDRQDKFNQSFANIDSKEDRTLLQNSLLNVVETTCPSNSQTVTEEHNVPFQMKRDVPVLQNPLRGDYSVRHQHHRKEDKTEVAYLMDPLTCETTTVPRTEDSNNDEQNFFAASCDFNATSTRSKRSWVTSQPAIQAAIKNPTDQTRLTAAKESHVFLQKDGSLSLLPSEIDTPLYHVPTVNSLKQEVTIPLQKEEGVATFKSESYSLPDTELTYLKVETTIKRGEDSYTRTTYYSKGDLDLYTFQGQRLFQRDLLLAKAEFMQKND